MGFDFLKDITLDVPVKQKATKKVTVKLPENADLRVFANGKVYPSKAFAEKHNLEYKEREEVDGKLVPTGNGLDIFRATEWEMIRAHLPEGEDIVFITVVPKAEAKVDLFGSCRYEEDGSPKSSVFTQGSSTFAKTKLVPMLAEVLKFDWEAVEFIDLKVDEDAVVKSPNDVYYLPKTVSSGVNKGKDDVERRENITVNALVRVIGEETVEEDVDYEEVKEAAPELEPQSEVPQSPGNPEVSEDTGEVDNAKDWADKLQA